MSRLPVGWVESRLEAVCEITSGFGFPTHLQGRENGDFPFAKVRDISETVEAGAYEIATANHWVTEADLDTLKARPVPAGSTIFAKIGEAIRLQRRALTARSLLIDNNVMALSPVSPIEPRFIFHWFRGIDLYSLANATTVPSVRKSDVSEISVPLPPLNEQRRIVAKLEALQERTRNARAALEAIPPLIEKFRQSILAAAFRGDLTADWRAKNPRQHSDAEDTRPNLRVDIGRRRVSKPGGVHLDEQQFTDLPAGWRWESVEELFTRGAIIDFADGNHGAQYPRKALFGSDGVPFVTAMQLMNGNVDIAGSPRLNAVYARTLRKGWAQEGDTLLTHNATVGRVAAAPSGAGRFLLGTSVTYYRPDPSQLCGEYLTSALKAPNFQAQLQSIMSQTTRNQVSIQKQAFLRIPVAPLAEQREISSRISDALDLVVSIENQLEHSIAALDRLESSILAKAFRGELVPQDPNDEPASVLLERIRAEREAQAPATTRGRRSQQSRHPADDDATDTSDDEPSTASHRTERSAGGAIDTSPGRRPGIATPPDVRQSAGGAIDTIPGQRPGNPGKPATGTNTRPAPTRPANASRAPEGRLTSPAVVSIDDYDTEDILCVLRKALPTADRYSRDEFIRTVARELGFDRAGSRIREAIESTLPTAARRHILWYSGDEVWIANRTITDYTRDELKDYFLAAIGTTWHERPEAIRLATRYLGFTRTGLTIEDTWKSIINGLLRDGRLERDSSLIRRDKIYG